MTTTAKHLLSEIVAGLDGVSIPDDIAKVAQAITEQFATWLLLHEREELAAEIGKALIAERDRIRSITAYVEQLEKALELAASRLDASSRRVGDNDSRAAFGIAQWASEARAALGGSNE